MRLLLLGAGAGAVGGIAAGVFDFARSALSQLVAGPPDPAVGSPSWWQALLVPILGGALAGWLVHRGSAGRGPLGMAGIVQTTQARDRHLPLRDGLATAAGAALALGTGHSGGREAPVAALAATLVQQLGERLRLRPADRRVLVAAAAAAAIAASFNTPLGSALLALEVVLGSFALRHFGPVVAATVVGTLVGQALLGTRVAFHAPDFVLGSPLELLAYAGLGVACAAVARAYTATIELVEVRIGGLALSPLTKAAASGLVVAGLVAVGLPQVAGTGYPLIDRLLRDPASLGLPMLAALLVGKLVATGAMWGGRLGPGLFSPVLVVGATAGALFGLGLDALVPAPLASPGSYALVGMGAVAAAVLKAPLAMTLVLFELTGSYAVVPTMLLTIGVSSVVSLALEPTSLYEALLAQRGVLLHRELPAPLRSRTVGELMRRTGLVTVPHDGVVADLVAAFARTRDDMVWVVDGNGRLAGAIDVQDVLDAVPTPDEPAARLVQKVAPLHPEDPAARALEVLDGMEGDCAPVVDGEGRLVGVLPERALLDALHEEG